jgi:DNA-binding Lrp family transcriptional regulator
MYRSSSFYNNNADQKISLDNIDFKIISQLITNHDNKQISQELNIPLSTIQRRVRNILLSGIVTMNLEPDFKRRGIKKGLIHVYLRDGNIKKRAHEVAKLDGMLTVSVHVGKSDIVGEFVYEDSAHLADAISAIKHMGGVERVLSSEEVYAAQVNPENILSSFQKMWNNNSSRKNRNSANKVSRSIKEQY